MKKSKTKFSLSLSVLIIALLLNSTSLSIINTKASVEIKDNQYNTESFDLSTWKWTTTEVVSTESTSVSFGPSLAVDTYGNVHITWYDGTDYAGSGSDIDIFYKYWDAATESWNATEVVSTESTGESFTPSLAVDTSGNVHIAWEDYTDYTGSGTDLDIFYKYWDAATESWNISEVVSTESTSYSDNPSLAVDAFGQAHIAWEDYTDYEGSGTDRDIFYKRWNASTSSWEITEVVSTESTSYSDNPSLAVDSSWNVHIAWEDYTDYAGSGTDWDIFYKCWNNTFAGWNATEVVSTESTGDSSLPSLAVDTSGNVHITWQDDTDYAGSGNDQDVFYKYWNATTTVWNVTEVVSTESTGMSSAPSLAMDVLGYAHIAWRDLTDYAGSGTDWDVFYKYWNTTSSAWNATEVVSTESTDDTYGPSLAVDVLGYVHIAWDDYTDYAGSGTDLDIFYKLFAGPPPTPTLSPISPKTTYSATISLDWNDVPGASVYYIYRSTADILSVEGLTPIGNTVTSSYIDTLPTEGTFYYVIVAANFVGNSTLSNCENVGYILSGKGNTIEVVSTESTGASSQASLIADADGNIHIAWQDATDYAGSGTDWDIFYKYWNATSSTWNATEVVSTESIGVSAAVSLAVDADGNVHITWQDTTDYAGSGTDCDIFYKRWNASSSSWTITEVVSTESTGKSYHPSLAVDSLGNVHIAWDDQTAYAGAGGDYDIFYKRWNVSTSSWTITEVVSTESTGLSAEPSLAVDSDGNVHIAWYDDTDYAGASFDRDIFYKYWNASSESWNATEVVSTESTNDSWHPSLAVDTFGYVHIAWDDYTDYTGAGTDCDIFYKYFDTSTESWNATKVVSTESTHLSYYPSLAVDTFGYVHIAWYDLTDYAGSGTDWDIFYKYWDASSFAWNATEVVSTESTDHSYYPSLAVDVLGYVHIAWDDSTDYAGSGTDWDIFYKLFAGSPTAPILSPISPNPTDSATISLDWNDVPGASLYYIYRSAANILSVEGLTPIGETVTSFYVDTLPTEGTFNYVIVAKNFVGNSTLSNCESVVYVPAIYEFSTISGLILATFAFLIVILRTRKKKSKLN